MIESARSGHCRRRSHRGHEALACPAATCRARAAPAQGGRAAGTVMQRCPPADAPIHGARGTGGRAGEGMRGGRGTSGWLAGGGVGQLASQRWSRPAGELGGQPAVGQRVPPWTQTWSARRWAEQRQAVGGVGAPLLLLLLLG